jgi:hypothetical protein
MILKHGGSQVRPGNTRVTRIIKDEASGMWRVVCPVHGELARFSRYWTAARDAQQHNGVCGTE